MTIEEQHEQINKELEEFYTERYNDWVQYLKQTTDLSDEEIRAKLENCTYILTDGVKNAKLEDKLNLLKELKEDFENWKQNKNLK